MTDDALATMTLNRTREFGGVHPPEQLLCAGGRCIPVSFQEERPATYAKFIADAGDDIDYKTRCYEQDGFSFDATGAIILETLDATARARAKKIEAKRLAGIAARKAHDEAMRAQGFEGGQFVEFEESAPSGPVSATDVASNPNDGAAPDKDAPKVGNAFDVVAWAQGKAQAPWFVVAKAMRETYGLNPQNKAQAIEMLIEKGIVSPAAVAA